MNIILTGYRCTGKSSTGRRLSARLGRPLFDTDDLILHRTGKSVEEIVAAGGWPAFRDAERAVIRNLSLLDGGIIATGGGALMDPRNVAYLRDNGLFVWLMADAATIAGRLAKDQADGNRRPSLSGKPVVEEVREILTQREPVYRSIADLSVDTASRGVEEVATLICRHLPAQPPRALGAEPIARRKEG
jgi:shikimate kinase